MKHTRIFDLLSAAIRKKMFGGRERMGLLGEMTIELRGPDGQLKEVVHKKNLIVSAGFDMIADALGKTSGRPAIISHIAIGTSSTAASSGQTALQTHLVRQAATYAHTSTTLVFTMTTTFAAGVGTGAITEAGVFNDPTTGTMLDRVVFSVVNKGAGDTMAVTFTFTMS